MSRFVIGFSVCCVLFSAVATAQEGRWKRGGDGSCYWDGNDGGPNQCEPGQRTDPSPTLESQLTEEQLTVLSRLAPAGQRLVDAGVQTWNEEQLIANAWWVIAVYQSYGVPESFGVTVQDAYTAYVAYAQERGTPIAFHQGEPPIARLVRVFQKYAPCAETKAKAGAAQRLGRTLSQLAWTNTAAAGIVAGIMVPTGPGALIAAAPFGIAAATLGMMATVSSWIASDYNAVFCIKGEFKEWQFPMIRASVVPPARYEPSFRLASLRSARSPFCA